MKRLLLWAIYSMLDGNSERWEPHLKKAFGMSGTDSKIHLVIWSLMISIIAFVGEVNAEGTYTLVAPNTLRVNSTYHVSITIHSATDPVGIEVTINGSSVLHLDKVYSISRHAVLSAGEKQTLDFQIGDWEDGEFQIHVRGSGGIQFQRQEYLFLNRKGLSVFVQTDKAIYKPAQLVQFRVLVVDPNLRAKDDTKLDIYISDAEQNRIKQLNNVETYRGIYTGELQLSDQPVLGSWVIFVKIGNQVATKEFSVEEYVLPEFKVNVQLPVYATFNDSEVVVSVSAEYNYGRPVKGDVHLQVQDSFCKHRFSHCEKQPYRVSTSIDGKTDITINLVKELDLVDVWSYQRKSVDFVATVIDSLSGRKENGSAELKIYSEKHFLVLSQSSATYKPGLPHTTTISVATRDGTPVEDNETPVILNYGFTYNTQRWQKREFFLPKNGTVTYTFVPPLDSDIVQFKAEYKGATAHDTIERASSISENYINVAVISSSPKVGDEVELEINSTTVLVGDFQVLVVGRGDILLSQSLPSLNSSSNWFKILLTPSMAPFVRVIVYFVTSCGEVLSDAIDFPVEGVFKTPVSVEITPNKTKPGSAVDINVSTRPKAFVGLLAVDQSVLLLKTGNDITQKLILEDLQQYDIGRRASYYFNYLISRGEQRQFSWNRPDVGSTSRVFDSAGLIFFSNGLLFRYPSFSRPGVAFSGAGGGSAGGGPSLGADHKVGVDERIDKPKLRKHFPETWLWTNATASGDGHVVLNTTVPDTITSWVVTAFAMDDEYGLGIMQEPTKVEVFRPFFASLNLPYSVVRGEAVQIHVIVFNYLKEETEATVILEQNEDFQFLDDDENSNSTSNQQIVQVKAGDGSSVYFNVVPLKIGYLNLKVTATSNVAGDALVKKLLVKPEGAPQFFNHAILVDLRNQSSANASVKVEIPAGVVNDSQRVEVSAISDIMGPTINNLDKLLRMPFGCGEQNMVNFVPNVIVTEYLNKTDLLTSGLLQKALKHMDTGYQRELTYRRKDSSFSAFGNRDKKGSTWLTAFVAKSFQRARSYITIDKNVINGSLSWLASIQNPNGSFPEVGEVHSKLLQGGAGNGTSLTAYVLIAFLQNQLEFPWVDVIQRAVGYLEEQLNSTQDVYDLAITTYALQLTNSSLAQEALETLNQKAISQGNLVRWSKRLPPEFTNQDEFYLRPLSVDVEMSSYALLALIAANRVTEGLPVMRWLVSQRNDLGGFASTQDTVIGIEALAALASHISSAPNTSLDITLSYQNRKKEIQINSENSMILQKIILPPDVTEVDIAANGDGVGIVQVSWSYYINTTNEKQAFNLTVRMDPDGRNKTIAVTACAQYLEEGASNMAVIEVHFPSGYLADESTFSILRQVPNFKRVETKEDNSIVILYFDRIGQKPVCPTLVANRIYNVAKLKPSAVLVYDYYDTSKRAEAYYEGPEVSL